MCMHDFETAARPQDADGHAPDDTPPRCPRSRTLSKLTCEWSISLDYAGLGELMDRVFDLWDMLNLDARDERIGDGFSGLVEHIAELREWTGWDGVAGIYTGEVNP